MKFFYRSGARVDAAHQAASTIGLVFDEDDNDIEGMR